MEKFTVDLDKVLDEFEFNEEQAIRHALQHFKREDLPATKYQKPHFKPINIADADFGPCIETTMSYSPFHHAFCTQESTRSLPGSSPPMLDRVIDESKSSNSEKDAESLTENNLPEIKEELHQFVCSNKENSSNFSGDKNGLETAVNCKIAEDKKTKLYSKDEDEINVSVYARIKMENMENEQIKVEKNVSSEIKPKKEKNNTIRGEVVEIEHSERQDENRLENGKETTKEVKKINLVEESKEKKEKESESASQSPGLEVKKITKEKEDIIREEQKNESEERKREEADENYHEFLESRHKPDLIENELVYSMSNDVKMSSGKRLPDLTEVIPKISNEGEREEERISDQIENSKEIDDEEGEKGDAKAALVAEAVPSSFDVDSSVDSSCSAVVGNGIVDVAPIQFYSQVDITDEELQKYLEELEEEEELEKKKARADSKPPRPDSLNLEEPKEDPGSPGLTPLTKFATDEEGSRSAETNAEDEVTETKKNGSGPPEDEIYHSVEFTSGESPLTIGERRLGKVSPFWMPDHLASSCMECDSKFTVIKRRHHCRACGRILCSKCCGMRASLEYLQNQEQRVCETCFRTLAKVMMYELQSESESESSPKRRPNPNNPMEYCSTVPPPLQVSGAGNQPPPSVLVPVGVLKREGSSKVKETPKQVMFSDGIRPGGDLTELDGSGDHRNAFRKSGKATKRAGTPPGNAAPPSSIMLPPMDSVNQSFVLEKGLPPICIINKGETTYEENWSLAKIMERLRDPESPPLLFAINRNLGAFLKIVKLDCCMKETCWVICSKGMGCVGQDEIIVLLTLKGEEDEPFPREILLQFHYIYKEAARGNTVNELGYWCVKESSFLESKQHGGFLFVRPTFQCLNRIEVPPPPFLFGILIHRSEIPWARVFPFRLMLRLGAEFRYYPCPLVSVRFREPVYYEVGHTIINLLADFRNLSYTLPSVRGLKIHMEANQTSILIPRNRYDQVVRALNNSNDPVLALAGNFSPEADAHLVCMQSKGNEITYSTHAININDKPRKVTGASFVVLNGALKTTSGVAAKSSIVEDGLMVQVPSDTMTSLRAKLRNMEDWSVSCGSAEGRNAEEVVRIVWCEDDKNFNVGVKSVIDNMPLDGVPSIRVHSGKDYLGCTKFIRWTQVFIIKCEDGVTSAKIGDPLEVNKLAESIAKATCLALTKLLELLSASGLTVLAVRATIDQDNVGYEAGSNGEKLAPIYMNSLDNELIPVLHKAASLNDSSAVLELMFHVMDQ